ncbi:MAG TPA: hypothetical protein VGD22_05670 [Sphingobacteriaceae bacterium]
MAFPIPLTVKLSDLADCHFQAAMDLINHDDANDDQEIYDVTIEIDGIDTELQFLALKERLEDVLTEYKLEEHFPNILYLYSIFLQFDAGDFLYKEELLKHASKTVKKLIALQKIKEGSQNKDLSLKIRNERISKLEVIFDQPFIITKIWDDLYHSIIKTASNGNEILREYLANQEITLSLLEATDKKLRVRTGSFWNKALASFSLTILYYLNKRDIFKGETEFSSQQGRFIFDLLKAFNLIRLKIESDEDDYIRTLIKNNKNI